MKTQKVEKSFDCIEYKRRVQAEIYDEIRDLSHGQQVEYFRRRAEEGALGNWWRSVKQAHAARRSD